MPLHEAWKKCPDGKCLSALALYHYLKAEGRLDQEHGGDFSTPVQPVRMPSVYTTGFDHTRPRAAFVQRIR